MKRVGLGLLVVIISLLFAGCNNDDDYSLGNYWITIGNIEGENGNFMVVTDDGDRLFPSANAVPGYPINDGDRLWVNYTILDDGAEDSNIDYYIKINNFSDILTKGIFTLTPENADSIGHDPIWVPNPVDDIWISNNYLNIFFTYEGAPWIVHYINVVSDIDEPTTPEELPLLELRHNKNDDPYNEPPIRGFISIDLKSLQVEGQDSVKFILRALGHGGELSLDEELTYSYTSVDSTIATSIITKSIPAIIKIK